MSMADFVRLWFRANLLANVKVRDAIIACAIMCVAVLAVGHLLQSLLYDVVAGILLGGVIVVSQKIQQLKEQGQW